MNKELALLVKEIGHWIEICKRQDMDNHVQAYEHVLVLIDRVCVHYELEAIE